MPEDRPDTRLTLLMWMAGGLLAFLMAMVIFLFTLVTGVVKDLRADIAEIRREQDRLAYRVQMHHASSPLIKE